MNSSFHSAITKPKTNLVVPPPMSEKEYKDKTDSIIKTYQTKIQELEEQIKHLNSRVENDQNDTDKKILIRLQQEESTYK